MQPSTNPDDPSGVSADPESVAQQAAEATVKKAADDKSATRWAIAIIVAVAVVIAICVAKSNTGSQASNQAISACENSVKAQLKAPSTAKFSGERYTDNDPGWYVTGSVDAQNSFGAAIRSSFSCNLTHVGNQWVVDSTQVL